MAEQKSLEQAKVVFGTLCNVLDNLEWHYQKDEEKLTIECEVQGEDLPIDITVMIDAERMFVILISHIPFVIKEDKRLDLAIAVSVVNNDLIDGCFDYDITSGHMFFRMTNSFIESTIGEEVFKYMIFCSCKTIDEYNDKFMMLAKGVISIEQFISALHN